MEISNTHTIYIGGTLCMDALWTEQIHTLPNPYTIAHIMEYTSVHDAGTALLQNAPDTFNIVAFSAGVPIALAMGRMLMKYDAIHRLEKIVLIAGNPNTIPVEEHTHFEQANTYVQNVGLEAYAREFLTQNIAPNHPNHHHISERIIHMATHFTPAHFHAHTQLLKNRPCSLHTLKHIPCPLLAVSGEYDTVCPPALHENMAMLAQNGTHICLQSTGHYATLENTYTLNTSLQEFLNI